MNLCPHCAVPSRAPSTLLQWSTPSVEGDLDLCCATVPCTATTSFVLGTSRPLIYNQRLRSALRVAFLMPWALGLQFRECGCVVCRAHIQECLSLSTVPGLTRSLCFTHLDLLQVGSRGHRDLNAAQHVVLLWAVPLVGSPASQFCLPRGFV